VSAVSPFRLFGRPPEPGAALEPDDGGVTWAPGPWDHDTAPATRHARPVAFGGALEPGFVGDDGTGRAVDDDPPTDPHGFPPVLGHLTAVPTGPRPAGVPSGTAAPSTRAPEAAEAAALAGAFAADYLSWDEDDPGRRGQALAEHVAAAVGDPTLLGWDGRGRQRAEFALPGPVRPDGEDRVLVDVRVRVTPYRAVGDRTVDRAADTVEPEPAVAGVPAAAPAPTGRGWRSCASYWVRLSVPVGREDDRLVVDAAEEAGPDLDGVDDDVTDDLDEFDLVADDGTGVDAATGSAVPAPRAEPPRREPAPARLGAPPEPESAW
jgi:hypothetical protein